MRLIILSCFFLLCIKRSFAQPESKDALAIKYLLHTAHIGYKGGTASSFAYRDSLGNTYLITARHVFLESVLRTVKNKSQKVDSILFRSGDKVDFQLYNRKWLDVRAPIYFYNDSIDIAVIKLEGLMRTTDSAAFQFGYSSLVGGDCLFLGFPLSKSTDATKSSLGYYNPLPLVNKGVISGFQTNSEGRVDLDYISANNTFGYSGGPVMYFDTFKKHWVVFGIVSGYYNQQDNIVYNDGSSTSYAENSGIMFVTPIYFARDIINSIK